MLEHLLASSIVLAEDWEQLAPATRDRLGQCREIPVLLEWLVEHGLLTTYQAARVQAGKVHGLILGNYRVLERLGMGGMGMVYKAEHVHLRRPVAIKVLSVTGDCDAQLLPRFYAEMRTVAHLEHANIVSARDAGHVHAEFDAPTLHYFVMEYIPGKDLEQYVRSQGPLPVPEACDLIHQVASALAEAHRHQLVHRDIKPSNIRVTPDGQAKLLDFGLARHFHARVTEVGTLLGTVEYIAPEQVRDPRYVDIRADLYALGGTLFWCLTGVPPFPAKETIHQELACRLTQAPPHVRAQRPDVPAELEAVIARLMALNPDDRYPTPLEVTRALLPFLNTELREHAQMEAAGSRLAEHLPAREAAGPMSVVHQLLVVDDDPHVRRFCRHVLQGEGWECTEAADGLAALEALRERRFDLILLDIDMPKMTGPELCRHLRHIPPCPHLKIIMFSGRACPDEMARMLLAGADDYLTKPLSAVQLQAHVKSALRLKDAQDRSDQLNQQLLAVNRELEENLHARASDLVHARNAVVLALAKLVEHRDNETGTHLLRLQRYCRSLAEAAATTPSFADQIDSNFIDMLDCCVPLHDIGKVGLPDHILLKPGKLTPDERIIMQSHTIMGASTLTEVARQHGKALAFLQMAIDIARHHHERWDGNGYPDRLAGSDIPLAARIVAICDVYDALRSRRAYKPALSHMAVLQIMQENSEGHFDPALLEVFLTCAPQMERIYRDLTD